MKKLSIILALFLCLTQTGQAQESVRVFLPLVIKGNEMGHIPISNAWRIIKPTETTNMALNPSAETTGNFSAQGGATVTRSTTYQKYGLTSYHVVTTGHDQSLNLTLSALTNAAHWATARIRGNIPNEIRFSLGPSSQRPILLEKIDNHWDLYGVPFGQSESNGATSFTITQFGTDSGDFYVDGVQVEAQADWTTYCDGTQAGCAWNGDIDASTSTRSALSGDGGIPQDLYQEYRFFVQRVVGAAASPQTLNVDSYAILPGGELNSIKVESRQFTLIGKFICDTEMELHDNRQALLEILQNNRLIKLQFNGGRVQKEITVTYQGGLEGDLATFYGDFEAEGDDTWIENRRFIEKASIQFLAPDPYWYEVGESAAVLDTNDSATFRMVAGRLKETGQWDALGPPDAAGTYTGVFAAEEDGTYVYFGGNFLNFDGIANADRIVRYNKQTGAYSAMGTGTDGSVETIIRLPDGDIVIGGIFTSAGGVANTSYIARWDIVDETWNPLSTGANSTVNDLAVGLDGKLFAIGGFTSIGGVAANRVAYFENSAWVAMGTGLNDVGSAITVSPTTGLVIVVGPFTSAGGVANTSRVASWNGSVFAALGTGVNDWATACGYKKDGTLIIGGIFTSAGGVAVNGIASWNGTSFSGLGSGLNAGSQTIVESQDGTVFVGGSFTSAGGLTLADRMARWNNYAWAHLDIDLPGTPTVYEIIPSKYTDPAVNQKYDLFVVFSTTGTGSFAGKITATNEGNVPVFPKIAFSRSGGTSAIIETLKNETTGKELLFNYSLLDAERLTIDLTPGKKSIISNFFGSRPDAILANSDEGTWALLPGDNDVTSFVAEGGGPTITAWMQWREAFSSY